MKAKMLVDFNEHIKKGDAPPKGREAHFVKIGLAEKVEQVPVSKEIDAVIRAAGTSRTEAQAIRSKAKAK